MTERSGSHSLFNPASPEALLACDFLQLQKVVYKPSITTPPKQKVQRTRIEINPAAFAALGFYPRDSFGAVERWLGPLLLKSEFRPCVTRNVLSTCQFADETRP